MNMSTYIAKRFLLGERGVGASRFTGWIAIAGMAVGCFALVLSIAVLNGFEKILKVPRIGKRIFTSMKSIYYFPSDYIK